MTIKNWLKNYNFFYRQGTYLSYTLKRMLQISIQPHLGFVCCARYPKPISVTEKWNANISEQSDKISSYNGYKETNWIKQFFKKCIGYQSKVDLISTSKVRAYIFKNGASPVTSLMYISNIFALNYSPIVKIRRSLDSLIEPIYEVFLFIFGI